MANDVLARLAVQIDAKTAQFGTALNVLSGQLNKFGASVNAQTASISNFEKRIATIQRSLGSLGVAFGAFQIANIVQQSIQKIAAFEQQIATVSAIAGATGDQLRKLRDDALRLGASTQFTAIEVAKLQTEFGRLGFSTEEIIAATEATLDLATATGEDLAKSADVAGSTVRAFGFSAEETQRVVDVMALSFNKSALGLENFTNSMKFVAPVAAAAGVSLEETTALLGVLADAGIRGSIAGTGLRRIITDLAKDGRPLADRLQELGEKGLTFGGAMDEVGRFAQSALLVLTKNVDKVQEATIAYGDAAGAAKETADIMRDTLTGDVTKLTSAWDGFILSLDKGDGSLRSAVQSLTSLVNAITKISDSAFGDFVAEWFKLTQTVPRLLFGAIDLMATWGDEIKISKEEASGLFNELTRLRSIAELEGKADEAELYASKIQQLTDKFGDLGLKAGFVGPQLAAAFPDPVILKGLAEGGEEVVGIIANLERQAKDFGDQLKAATSLSEIRRLEDQLEGVQIRLNAILNPSIAPEPIKIPIEFAAPDLSLKELSDKILAISTELSAANPEAFVIPVSVEIPPEARNQMDEQLDAMSERFRAFGESVSEILTEGIGNALTGLGQDLGNAIAGVGRFGDNIIRALADFAGQFGKLLILTGLGKIAFEKLKFPGAGVLLVAAGVALTAAAQAVNAQLSKATGALSGAGGSAGGGGGGFTTPERLSQTAQQAQRIDFGEVVFKQRGQDLIAVISAQQNVNNRLGG
jgi:hypothetical protein